MTVALVLLAVTGWGLALALLIGRGIDLADQREARAIDARPDQLTWMRTETIKKTGRRR